MATIRISMMVDIPEDIIKDIENIDISQIVSLRDKIEAMLNEK